MDFLNYLTKLSDISLFDFYMRLYECLLRNYTFIFMRLKLCVSRFPFKKNEHHKSRIKSSNAFIRALIG